jgi:hypothetical protein
LSYVNDNYEKLIDILEKESSVLIDWFNFNCMQANPDKFQAIAVGNKTHAKTPVFKNVVNKNFKKQGAKYRALRYPFLYISPTAEISLKFDLLFTTS